MLCQFCGKSGPEKDIAYLACRVCQIDRSVDEYFRSAYISIISLYYGKFILKSHNKVSQLNESLGFSSRQERKHLIGIHTIIDRVNFRNSYILLANYLEAILNLICAEYEYIKNNYDEIPSFSFNMEDDYSAFILGEKDNIPKPKFWEIARFVHLVNNVMKHSDGVIKNNKSGKRIIEAYGLYGFSEGRSLFDFEGKNIPSLVPEIKIGDTISVVAMLLMYSKNLLAQLYDAPNLNSFPLDIEETLERINDVELRPSILDLLEKELKKDNIVHFTE